MTITNGFGLVAPFYAALPTKWYFYPEIIAISTKDILRRIYSEAFNNFQNVSVISRLVIYFYTSFWASDIILCQFIIKQRISSPKLHV